MSRLVEDRRLREAFKQGDRSALGEVYRVYVREVYAFVRGKLRTMGRDDAFEADNIVQDVFVKAFADSARLAYDGLRPYRNYLFTIARNRIVDELRKGGRVHVSMDDDDDESTLQLSDPDAPLPEQASLNEELQRLVAAFIGGLEAGERQIFSARFERGLSVEACAQELGFSEYRVKRDEKRLRKLFFTHMHRGGYFEGYSREELLAVMGLLLPLVSAAVAALIARGGSP